MTFLRDIFRSILLLFLLSCNTRTNVSLIIHHAKIYTVDSSFSIAEAMAIKDGRVLALGTSADILKTYKADTVIDAAGKTIFPGFIDAHCHFTGYATDSWKCNLFGTSSFEEVIEKVKAYSKTAPMLWIYGTGWDQNDWSNEAFPNKRVLDSLFPHTPVFLKRIDGHAALVNQKALDLAGINSTTHLSGGSVEIKNGQLTGILLDNAMDIVDKIVPALPDSLAKQYYVQLQKKCFAVGLTGVQDCGVNEHTIQLVDEEQKAGRLKMKIFALLSDSVAYYDRWIKRVHIKQIDYM